MLGPAPVAAVPYFASSEDFAFAESFEAVAASEAADAADKAEGVTALSGAPAVPNQQRTCCPACTQIPLASLFNFTQLDNGLDFYWKGAIRNLDADAAACELAFAQQEGLQVPGMSDTSSSSSSSLA